MEEQENLISEDIVSDAGLAVKDIFPKEIKVKVHIPKEMSETLRQQKINKIYEILKPKAPR